MNIQALPEELLLAILHQLLTLPNHRRRNLITISSVNRLFRRLAQEELLTQPMVHVLNTHHLVRTYFKYPHLADKVTRLELLTHIRAGFESKLNPTLWHQRTASCFAPVLDEDFKQACEKIIHGTTIPAQSKATWIEDLLPGHQNAFLCILFAILSKLKSLYLGTGTLNQFPFLKVALDLNWTPPCEIAIENRCKEFGLPRWTAIYLFEVFKGVGTRLEYLELPLGWEDKLRVLQDYKMSLHGCKSLKHLSLSYKAFQNFGLFDSPGGSIDFFSHIRRRVLPEGLETLTILVGAECHMREDYFRRCLSMLKRNCSNLPNVNFVYDFGLAPSIRQYRRTVEYGHGLGLEVTHLSQPPWRLYAAMIRGFVGLYSWELVSQRNDLFVYDSRQCYSELTRLR